MKDAIIIGIAGGTGCGKSTMIRKIKEEFNDEISILSHDFYYKQHNDIPFEERKKINYDHPNAFDTDIMIGHIRELAKGNAIERPVYDFTIHNRVDETVRVEPARVIVVEGILIFENKELRDLCDIKVYIDTDADVRIIPTKSVGDGFAVMSMYDATPDSADEIEEAMKESCQGVVTVEISRCIRDSSMQGLDIRCGQYIALDGKNILSQGETAEEAAVSALPLMELDDHALLVILKGAGGTDEGSLAIKQAASVHPYLETVETDGGQDIYDYILIAE